MGGFICIFSGKGIGTDTGKELNDIAEKGAKTLKIIYDEDKNPSRNNFIKLRQENRNNLNNGRRQMRDEDDLL